MLSRTQTRGFTLIEILVVIVIVATIVSIALLSVNVASRDDEIERERRRLASLIETAQDDALMQGREFGIEIMSSSYRFVEFDPLSRQWSEVIGDDLYRLRALPEGIEFDLFIDDKRIDLALDPKELEEPDESTSRNSQPFAPHLFVFSSGQGTVFELHLWRPATDHRLTLRGDVLGELEFGDNDEI